MLAICIDPFAHLIFLGLSLLSLLVVCLCIAIIYATARGVKDVLGRRKGNVDHDN